MGNNHGKYTEMLKRMEKEAVEELLNYHRRDWKQKAKNTVKRAAGRYVPPMDMIFWPTGLIANVLAENLDAWEDGKNILQALRIYFDRWITKGMPLYYVDDVLCGVALLIIYEETGEEKYRTGADKMAEYLFELWDREADASGSIPYRPAQKNRHVYVDGIGMICPFLSMYGVRFGNEKAVEIALTQIENMLKYGMDEKTGLPYHGFQYENRIKYGIIGWGRAVGWLLMGMAGVLKALAAEEVTVNPAESKQESSHDGKKGSDYRENREYEANPMRINNLAEAFKEIADKTMTYQRENGAFSWQLEAVEGPEDSSASAMVACAVLDGLEGGILETGNRASYENLAARTGAYLAECETEGKIGKCLGECAGFSQYPQIYGAYPWSLGTALKVMLFEREHS